MRTTLLTTATLAFVTACARSPKEAPTSDAAPPIARPAPPTATATTSSPVGSVTIPGTIDRAQAEQIGLEYARKRWPQYGPKIATAFILHDGSFHVVVGFHKRGDAASVYVRSSDGEVMDASIAGSP